jgi:hypothetical protein
MPAPTELPEPRLAGFTTAQLELARAAWPLRAAEELRSALIYRALSIASRVALPAWSERFAGVMRDELEHTRLCAAVGARLGAPPPRYDARPVRARVAPLRDPIARTAALVLSEVAIGETISTSLLHAARRETREPLARFAIDRILRDEVRHQRLGWDALAVLGPTLTAAQHDALAREASLTFAAAETSIALPVLRSLEAGEPFDPAWSALGVLAFEARADAFYRAVDRFVIPRLARLGIDGARAWRDRYAR